MTGQQLKNSILQMAVQGKLVPQDPNDEPASVLLERIRKEKEQLIREGKIKKEKNPSYIFRGADNLPYEKVGKNDPVCIADEVPFDIPDSWEWARISTIFTLQAGKNIQAADISESDFDGAYLCYGGNGVRGYVKSYNREGNYPIIGRQGALCGNIKYANGKFYATEHAVCVETFAQTNVEWACAFLEALNLNQYATATAQPGLAVANINTILIPVPPKNEQQQIVNVLISLQPFVESYAQKEFELNSLNQQFPDSLKKSILQEAIRGKLVPQDPTDEPASALLERIRAEKDQLIKAGKIKRDKHESIIFRRDNSHYEKLDGIERCIDDELPFEIPDSWVWSRFGQVISLLSGTDFKPEEYNDIQKGIPYITGASSLSENGVLLNRWTETPRVIANCGDVLLVCKGSGYGKTVICDIEEAHIARQIMAIKKFITLDMHYVRLFLQANFDKIKSKGQGVIPGIDRNSIMNLLFSIPPLPEQHRIVEKQRELFDKITLI